LPKGNFACRDHISRTKAFFLPFCARTKGDGLPATSCRPEEILAGQTPACVSEGVPLPKSDFSLPDFRQKDAADWLAAKPRADINDGGIPL